MIGTLRDDAERHDRLLIERLDTVVPALMEELGIDAWVVAGREYNEDPVLSTMLPATWLSARRRTVLVFTQHGRSRCAVARYAVGEAFGASWDPDDQPDQWAAVAAVLGEAQPGTIAVNSSAETALADGLTASEMDALAHALPADLRERIVPGDVLAVGWLETRVPAEIDDLREACVIAHGHLARALSDEVIRAGSTTTDDVVWWLREEVRGAGLSSWFHPTVTVQRRGGLPRTGFAEVPSPLVIEFGDLIHIDFGLVHRRMHTDQQQHGYVLRPGERTAPDGLVSALRDANRVQDLLLAEMRPGRTGNDVLSSALGAARAQGLRPRIYTHPIGLHGHAAGPTIGLWDRQDGVPGDGDRVLRSATAFSIELQVVAAVPEWDGADVAIMLEEEALLGEEMIAWIDGRQTAFHLI